MVALLLVLLVVAVVAVVVVAVVSLALPSDSGLVTGGRATTRKNAAPKRRTCQKIACRVSVSVRL